MAATWKWYVYQFFAADGVCVYVGKGSNDRFKRQSKRFKGFSGAITAYFESERDAFDHERALIIDLSPSFNKAMMPVKPKPWLYMLLPEDKDFYAWCAILGTRAMAARVLLSFRKYVDPSKLDAIRQVAYGYR